MYQKQIMQMLDNPEDIKLFELKDELEADGYIVSQDDLIVARIALTCVNQKDRAFWETIARLERMV